MTDAAKIPTQWIAAIAAKTETETYSNLALCWRLLTSRSISVENLLPALVSLPLPTRRRALRAIWRIDQARGRIGDPGVGAIIGHVLTLPAASAIRIDRELGFLQLMSRLEWLALSTRPFQALLDNAKAYVRIPNSPMLDHVAKSGRPVIITMLHMGAFGLGLGSVIARFFRDRPLLILHSRDGAFMARAAMRLSEVAAPCLLDINDRAAVASALRGLRDKNTVIITFADLPPGYGRTMEISFFHERIRMSMGHDSLARIMDGIVVPLAVRSWGGGDVVNVGQAYEVHNKGAASRAEVAERTRRHLEDALRAWPHGWHQWRRIHEFFNGADHATGSE